MKKATQQAVIALCLMACASPAQVPQDAGLARSPDEKQADAAGIGRTFTNLRVTTINGAAFTLDELLKGKQGLVVAMTSAECPIARKYAPRLAALEAAFDGRVAFLYVNPVDGEAIETMRASIRAAGLRGPYATDANGHVRRELSPSTTTEVLVLDAARTLVYRGAVDDQYRLGGAASKTSKHFLKDAIEAVIAEKAPTVRATDAPGCLVDAPKDAKQSEKHTAPSPRTYYPDIAGIVARNCVECHRRGGNGPFSLEAPAAVEGRSSMIAAVVREGLMPPTHALRSGPAGPLVLDRAMGQEDREKLIAWLQSSREAGDAAATITKVDASNTWTIGTPDMILTTPGPTLAADGPLQHGRYLVPVNLDTDRWVEAIECRPMMHDSIEHAVVWLVPPGGKVPTADDMPPGAELFVTYSRSDRIVRYPTDSARKLVTGSLLVADIYARPMGKPTLGQIRIGLKFANGLRAREVRAMVVASGPFTLAAGDSQGHVEASATLREPTRIVALQPYMGPRGRELVVQAEVPGRPALTLLDLGRYDWRWQIRYVLKEPIDLPAGTKLVVQGRFDNSAANPANPDARQAVAMGAGLGHESLLVSVEHDAPASPPKRGP